MWSQTMKPGERFRAILALPYTRSILVLQLKLQIGSNIIMKVAGVIQ